MQGKAIVLSGGQYDTKSSKTTHGLVRGSERFQVEAVIDPIFFGNDAGELLDGRHRGIPMLKTVKDFLATGKTADYCVVGIAPKGGKLPPAMREDIVTALENGISIVSGLHQFLMEDVALVEIAKLNMADIYDIRKPRLKSELNFWKGDILKVTCPKIVVLGTDCGLGKRTTAKMIVEELRKQNYLSEMIFTGQTGWLQGWKYGFILDSTYNDFVSGELEYMMHKCWEIENPDMMVVEGQASLRNPSGPCGAEFLISGHMDGVILQHAPARVHYDGFSHLDLRIPPIETEITLIEAFGVPVLGISLNTKGLTLEEAKKYQAEYETKLKLPVALPVEEGVEKFLPALKKLMNK